MSIPTHLQIMLPLLKLYSDNNIHHRTDFIDKISDHFNLTDDERKQKVNSGWTRISDRVDWAITFLKSAKLVESPKRGYTKITRRGKELLKTGVESLDLNKIKELYPDVMETAFWNPELRTSTNATATNINNENYTPDEHLAQIVEQKKLTIYAEIEDQIKEFLPKHLKN